MCGQVRMETQGRTGEQRQDTKKAGGLLSKATSMKVQGLQVRLLCYVL